MSIQMSSAHTVEVGYDEFCGVLGAQNLQPLWKVAKSLVPDFPVPNTKAWIWKWSDILPLAKRASEIITIERGGDRRVLGFVNPGLGGKPFTTSTLWGAFQYLGAGESAPAHRHTPSAIRFVLTGSGAYTNVNGDACDMEPGDLILTPNWTWHDHTNTGDGPMVWFDGLDLPLMTTLESIFFENFPDPMTEVTGHNVSTLSYSQAGLRPVGDEAPLKGYSPLMRYGRAATDEALTAMHKAKPGPIVSLEYTNPVTGASAIPTFASEMHRIYPGERTPTTRRTGSSVFVVFKGAGRSVIAGEVFAWEPGDVFVAPSWAPVDHQADEPSDLFAITDRPVLEVLRLYREEVAKSHQEITGTFDAQGT